MTPISRALRGSRALQFAARIAPFVFVLSLAQGCDRCTLLASSTESVREAGPHKARLEAQAHRKVGIDFLGAPHVGGIIFPTLEGHGYVVTLHVDDRSPITITAASTSSQPGEQELERALAAITIEGSPDGNHIAYKLDTKDWVVLHLLPAGPPFDAPGSHVAALDWPSLPSPEAIAVAAVRDAANDHAAPHKLLWQAVAEQTPGEPLDSAILEAWPAVKEALAWAARRTERQPPPSEAWRQAAAKKALAELTAKRVLEDAAALVVDANIPAELDAMDRELVKQWLDSSEAAESNAAMHLLRRRVACPNEKSKHLAEHPPSGAAKATMIEAARRAFAEKRRRDDAGLLLVAVGSDADRAWLDEQILAQWPEPDAEPYMRDVYDLLVARSEGSTHAFCGFKPAPPSDDMRRRILAKARALLDDKQNRDEASDVLVAIGVQPELDLGLDVWVSTYPDRSPSSLLRAAKRGSDAWKARTRATMEAMRVKAKADLPGAKVLEEVPIKSRLEWSSTLLFELERDTAPCDRLKDLKSTALHGQFEPSMPMRCHE